MQNAELDEAQAGIKIAGRNINNLGYTDHTTLMAESHQSVACGFSIKPCFLFKMQIILELQMMSLLLSDNVLPREEFTTLLEPRTLKWSKMPKKDEDAYRTPEP